jgi:hypothetical protein
MASVADRRSGGAAATTGRVARRGLWGLARLVMLATSLVVGVIVVGIVLVLLEANRANDVVNLVLNVGEFLVKPLHNVFKLHSHKAAVGVNWGLAALAYSLIGGFIARLLRR